MRTRGSGREAKGKMKARTVRDRRAAPVSKVFTIPAKNEVQKARLPRPGITGNKNQNHRPRIPRPPLAWLDLDCRD